MIGIFHVQLGPPFEALILASVKDPALRSQIQKTLSEHGHDPSASNEDWPKCSIVAATKASGQIGSSRSGAGMGVELPKYDLIAELPADCIASMVSWSFTEMSSLWHFILTFCLPGFHGEQDCLERKKSSHGGCREYGGTLRRTFGYD